MHYTANVLTIKTTGTGNCGVPAGKICTIYVKKNSVRIFLQHNSYRVIFGGVKKLKKLFLLAHFVTICPSFSFLTGRKVAFFPLNHEILQPLQLLTSGPSKAQGFSISTSHRRA